MKRRLLFILFILLAAFFCPGCGYFRHVSQNFRGANSEENFVIDGNTVVFDWGEYLIPEEWEFDEEYTDEKYIDVGKLFFKNTETMNDPNIYTNISVEHGINRYPVSEHERFRDAILKQLLNQIGDKKAQLTGDGSYTDSGYILYKFTIEEEDENITTVQYYILGDKEYVLVHLTDYHEQSGGEALEAAYEFAQSVVFYNYKE